MVSLTWPGALAWRLQRQLLEPVGSTSVVDVVATLGAVAAQLDPSSAELGLRTRLRSSAPGDVARALDEGRLVRTFAHRGAVHLMTPEHAAGTLALRAASRMWERPGWQSFYGLAPDDWPDLRAAVRAALTGGPLTRAELAAAVTAQPRFAHLVAAFTDPAATFLKPFAWQGDVSLGPARDGAMTLQRLDTRPGWPGLPDVEEAGPRAVEQYVRAYGPASEQNLAYWLVEGLGVRRTHVRRWVEACGDRLAAVDVEGEPRWVVRGDLDGLTAAGPSDAVRLLPRYDQWVLGPGTADAHVVPPDLRARVSRGADLVVHGGVVVGTWSVRGGTVGTSVDPGPVAADELDAEVARLAAVLGRPLERIEGTEGTEGTTS
ncbi:winged helix DNA-binding domain-containing protein [Cellulomonas sp. NS3]|uniref:winged helix DNA-binding domain-containing protein n=1 Tax=Cellulomonas sp. NS3 TaxID=2973977 RepID=UPI00216215C5|nr:winged helix DNA-binding domain-containing protein [Cellulomonas sp. NS3]